MQSSTLKDMRLQVDVAGKSLIVVADAEYVNSEIMPNMKLFPRSSIFEMFIRPVLCGLAVGI